MLTGRISHCPSCFARLWVYHNFSICPECGFISTHIARLPKMRPLETRSKTCPKCGYEFSSQPLMHFCGPPVFESEREPWRAYIRRASVDYKSGKALPAKCE